MATPKQLREIFAPVLAEHPDLVLHRRWLFRPPIKTAIIGLFIDRTSAANNSTIWLSVVPLSRFVTPSVLGFNKGFEVERIIGAPPPKQSIGAEKDEPPRIYQDMFASEYQSNLRLNFNAKARPFLDEVRTPDDVVAWIDRFREPSRRKSSIELFDSWLAAMQGDFATAADLLQADLDRMAWYSHVVGVTDVEQLQREILKILHTGDAVAVAAFLHELEHRTIAEFGLERYWQRTPFPFERG